MTLKDIRNQSIGQRRIQEQWMMKKFKNGNKKSRVNVKNNKFQCNLCEYGSDRNWLVKRHMKLIHWKNKKIAGKSKTIQNRNGNETPNDYVGYIEEGLRKNLMKDVVEKEEKSNLESKIYIIRFNI